jgi:hypothetical protein
MIISLLGVIALAAFNLWNEHRLAKSIRDHLSKVIG